MNKDAIFVINKIRDFDGDFDDAFYILQAMGKLVGEYGMQDSDVVRAAILLKSKHQEFVSVQGIFSEIIDDVMRQSGLYPYIENRESTFRDSLFYEINLHPKDKTFVFHNIQSKIFWDLADGKNLIVSAPTSFGKSAVIEPLIAFKKMKSVLIIVPTISLLDETRKRLEIKFGDEYQIVSHKRDVSRSDKPTLFVMTQERAIERDDIQELDLLVIDEFYKLDPRKDGGQRYRTLNRALYKYGRMAKQVYLLGPNIEYSQTKMLGKSFKVYQTDFQTVAVEVIENFGLDKSERTSKTIEILEEYNEDSTLVFVSSPKQANILALELLESEVASPSELAIAWGDELSENIHPDWVASKALSKGIGLHHGRLPRSTSQLNVKLFNAGEIKVLICTSSLIEGVNTVAKNIVIHHNKINRTKHDYFTFSNIKGRAGRMLQHYVGRVFLFEEAPVPINVEVEIPIVDNKLMEEENFLFDVSREDLSSAQREKVESICDEFEVSEECISKLMDYGITTNEQIDEFKRQLELYVDDNDVETNWVIPKFPQLLAAFDLLWQHMNFRVKGSRAGLYSTRQAAYVTFSLLNSDTIFDFLQGYMEGVPEYHDTNGDAVEAGFLFLRAAEFTLPSAIIDLSYFINTLLKKLGYDYSVFAYRLENWFKKSTVLALEENGVPYFISEEYEDELNDEMEISWNVQKVLRSMQSEGLFERIEYAFLRDSFPARYFVD